MRFAGKTKVAVQTTEEGDIISVTINTNVHSSSNECSYIYDVCCLCATGRNAHKDSETDIN